MAIEPTFGERIDAINRSVVEDTAAYCRNNVNDHDLGLIASGASAIKWSAMIKAARAEIKRRAAA